LNLKKGKNLKVPQNKWVYAIAGIATGFDLHL